MREPSNGNDSGSLEEVINAWWSRYCPTCKTRRPMNESTCPEDGAELRDLSLSAPLSFASTGFLGSTGELSWTSCPPLEETGLDAGDESPCLAHEDPSSLRAGLPEILGDKWRVLRKHGGGAFGTFLIGSHAILGMQVGIKLLRRRFTRTEAGRRLFHQEAMRLSLLNHPGIVKVLDYGEDGDRPYLVMEYLTGRPLHQYMAERSLKLEEGVEVVRQAAVALIAAHRGVGIGEPLVHLDLKPEHIFLEKIQGHWHVKVIDFGIAEIVSTPTDDPGDGTGSQDAAQKPVKKRVTGTLPYMAPERWRGVADPRCDIYSLGIILYELAAGKKPFAAEDPDVMRRMHEEEAPPAPSPLHHAGTATPDKNLDAIILWCLKKNAAERPQTAETLVEALEKWQARPRLSAGQRMLRAALVPLLVVFAVLGLFYWAPWEEIPLPPAFRDPITPPVLGPDPERPLGITIALPGPGYKGGSAELLITEGDGVAHPVPLGNAGDTVWLTWDHVKALPGAESGGEFTASISVRGRLGRTVTSEPFRLVLDNRLPSIVRVGGLVEQDDDPDTLWLLGSELSSELSITADEWLDAARCQLNGLSPLPAASEGKEQRSVQFSVPRDATEITVNLFDRAGNERLRKWNKVRRDEKPTLVSPVNKPELEAPRGEGNTDAITVLTNEPEYPLEVKISGACGKVKIGDETIANIKHGREGASCGKTILCDAADGVRGEFSLSVKVWSELSKRKDREPDVNRKIQVVCWHRSLKIVAEPDQAGVLPQRFKVEYRDGDQFREVPCGEVEWTGEALLDDGAKRVSFPVTISKDGQFKLPPNFESLPGKLMLLIRAKDDYGNRSELWEGRFGQLIDVTFDQFALASEEGSSQQPILHKDCPIRMKLGAGKGLDFKVHVEYQHRGALSYELRVGGSSAPDDGIPVVVVDGKAHVPEEKLFRFLHPGENEVFLVATDTTIAPPISGRISCFVYYAEPLEFKFDPADLATVAEEAVKVSVHATGPKIIDLKIGGERVPPSSGDRGLFQRRVLIKPVGTTPVEVSLTIQGGYVYPTKLNYSAAPREGGRYVHEVGGELGELELELVKGRVRGEDSWCAPPEVSAALLEKFRHSSAGRTFYDGANRVLKREGPATLAEAVAVSNWVTTSLPRGWLAKGGKVDLPTLQQLKLLQEKGRAFTKVGSPEIEMEWLSRDDEDSWAPYGNGSSKWPGSYAVRAENGGLVPRGADLSTPPASFRLMLRAGAGGLEPVHAKRWKPTEGGK